MGLSRTLCQPTMSSSDGGGTRLITAERERERSPEYPQSLPLSPFPAGSSSPSRCGGGAKIDFLLPVLFLHRQFFSGLFPVSPIFSTLFFFTHSGKGCLSITPNLVGAKKKAFPNLLFRTSYSFVPYLRSVVQYLRRGFGSFLPDETFFCRPTFLLFSTFLSSFSS